MSAFSKNESINLYIMVLLLILYFTEQLLCSCVKKIELGRLASADQGRLWLVRNKKKLALHMKNINYSNYRRLFLGTINTK